MNKNKKIVINQMTALFFSVIGGAIASDLLISLIPVIGTNFLLKSLSDICFIAIVFSLLNYVPFTGEKKNGLSTTTILTIISIVLGIAIFDTLILNHLAKIFPILLTSQLVYMLYMSVGILLVYKIITIIYEKTKTS